MTAALYQSLLGPDFARLPPMLRLFHDGASRAWRGEAEIERGTSLFARLAMWAAGFPPAGRAVPVTVHVEAHADHEIWRRDFGGHETRSRLSLGTEPGALLEQFGPTTCSLRIGLDGDGLAIRVSRLWIGPIPMPALFTPSSRSREFQDENGRYRFDISAFGPFGQLLIHYHGWLAPEAGAPAHTCLDHEGV